MVARISLIAAVAVLALAAAGCGSSSSSSAGSGSVGSGAAVAPADTIAFAAVDSNLSSDQWQAVDRLLQKFPSHDALLTQLRQGFEKSAKVSWNDDVKPALGDELDLAILPGAADKPQVVALTQPSDQGKLDQLLARLKSSGDTKLVSAQVDGWTVISDSQAALDAVKNASAHLADDNTYRDATAKLANPALARIYANGAEALQVAASLGGSALGQSIPTTGLPKLQWLSADVVATSGGVVVHGFSRSDQTGARSQPYASALVGQIPAGALAVADFQAPTESAMGSAGSALPQELQALLGTALGGETALYVSPGTPLPAVTLVTQPKDPQAAADAIDKLLAQALGAAGSGSSGLGSLFGGAGAGSTSGLDLGSILGALKPVHAIVGDTLVVSTAQAQIDAFKGAGQKLADDATFKEAKAASSLPDTTNGFLYVNLKDTIPAVQGFLELAGAKLPSALQGDLQPLRTLTAFGDRSGDLDSFTVFLEVR